MSHTYRPLEEVEPLPDVEAHWQEHALTTITLHLHTLADHWKKSSHYQMWKHTGKNTRKFHGGKEAQWSLLEEKMSGMQRSNDNKDGVGGGGGKKTPKRVYTVTQTMQ
jgi:hypothetical protein